MPLVVLVEGSGPLTADWVQQQLLAAEASVPEGARTELAIRYHPTTGAQAARAVADEINQRFRQGQLQLDGDPLLPWPGEEAIAFVDTAASTLYLRATKNAWPILVYLVLGILAVIVVYLVVQRWSYRAEGPPPGAPDGSPPGPSLGDRLLGWIRAAPALAALAAAVLVIPPLALLAGRWLQYQQALAEAAGGAETGGGAEEP